MSRVLIADDEFMVRAGVRAVLSAGGEIVAEAADGITAATEIRRVVHGTGVAMVTTFGEDDYVLCALGAGVTGFLVKSGDPEELIAGVRAVVDGVAFLSPKVDALSRRLGEVEGTVKLHVSAILTRLAVKNRAAAAFVAHEADIVPVEAAQEC